MCLETCLIQYAPYYDNSKHMCMANHIAKNLTELVFVLQEVIKIPVIEYFLVTLSHLTHRVIVIYHK